MGLKSKIVERGAAGPELVAFWRMGVGRTAPPQALDVARLIDGGALSGPMFEPRRRPFVRLLRRLVSPWTGR